MKLAVSAVRGMLVGAVVWRWERWKESAGLLLLRVFEESPL